MRPADSFLLGRELQARDEGGIESGSTNDYIYIVLYAILGFASSLYELYKRLRGQL